MISTSRAYGLLHSKVWTANLRKHCCAVSAATDALAKYFKGKDLGIIKT